MSHGSFEVQLLIYAPSESIASIENANVLQILRLRT